MVQELCGQQRLLLLSNSDPVLALWAPSTWTGPVLLCLTGVNSKSTYQSSCTLVYQLYRTFFHLMVYLLFLVARFT